jgi:hypothetical protein
MNVVLNYGPRHDHDHARSERVYLVWPTAAWRVVAPMPGERRINILQKAVLRTCQSATYTAAEIAARLHLHPDLIEAIGIELVGSGWLDSHEWRPTTKGLAVLDDEEVAMESLISGWVFQDPRTGDLWPFFASQLRLQEVEPTSNRLRIGLVLPTKSGTRLQNAWLPEALPPPGQPSAQAILSAVRRYRRREKLKGSMLLLDSGLEDPVGEGSPGSLSRITFISDQPEPAGLVTYAYVPQTSGLGPQICDPFGFGSAPSMWGSLQQMAQIDEAASGAMRELLQSARVNDAPALEEQLRRHRQMAEAYITERLSLNITTFSAVFTHLADAQQNLDLAQAAGGDPQGMLASVMTACRKALEALLKEVARKSPLNGVEKILTGDAKLDQVTVQGIAASVGFNAPLPKTLHDSIQGKGSPNDTQKRISDMAKNLKHVYSLQAAIIGMLCACQKDSDHPFRQAARRAPDLLNKIDAIRELGNPASHDESHNPKARRFVVSEAAHARDLSLEVAACLLGLPFRQN